MLSTNHVPSENFSLKEIAEELSVTQEFVLEVLQDEAFCGKVRSKDDFTAEEAKTICEFVNEVYLPEWTLPFGKLSKEEIESLRLGGKLSLR